MKYSNQNQIFLKQIHRGGNKERYIFIVELNFKNYKIQK